MAFYCCVNFYLFDGYIYCTFLVLIYSFLFRPIVFDSSFFFVFCIYHLPKFCWKKKPILLGNIYWVLAINKAFCQRSYYTLAQSNRAILWVRFHCSLHFIVKETEV